MWIEEPVQRKTNIPQQQRSNAASLCASSSQHSVVSQEPDEVSERSIVVDKIDKIDKIMNGAMTQQTAAPKRKILKAKRRALQPVDKTARVEETAPEDLAEQRSWWQRLFCSSRKRKHSAIHPLSSQLSDDGVVGDHGRVDSTESCSSVHTASPNNATFVSAVDPPREKSSCTTYVCDLCQQIQLKSQVLKDKSVKSMRTKPVRTMRSRGPCCMQLQHMHKQRLPQQLLVLLSVMLCLEPRKRDSSLVLQLLLPIPLVMNFIVFSRHAEKKLSKALRRHKKQPKIRTRLHYRILATLIRNACIVWGIDIFPVLTAYQC